MKKLLFLLSAVALPLIAEDDFTIPIADPLVLQNLSIPDELTPRHILNTRSGITDQHEIVGVPDYIWTYGCYPTALGMAVGYWVNNDPVLRASANLYKIYPPFLEDPNNSGQTISDPKLPMSNYSLNPAELKPLIWEYVGGDIITAENNCGNAQVAECPFIASREAIYANWVRDASHTFTDVTTEPGHVENTWEYFGDLDHDTQYDCIADYVRTSMGIEAVDGGTNLPFTFIGTSDNLTYVSGFTDYMQRVGGVYVYSCLSSVRTQMGLNMNFLGTLRGTGNPMVSNPDHVLHPDRVVSYNRVKDSYMSRGMNWTSFKSTIKDNLPVVLLVAREENVEATNSEGNTITVTKLVGHHAVLAYGFIEKDNYKFVKVKTTFPGNPTTVMYWDNFTPIPTGMAGHSTVRQYYGIMNAVEFFSPAVPEGETRQHSLRTSLSAPLQNISEGKNTNVLTILTQFPKTETLKLKLYHSTGIETVYSGSAESLIDGHIPAISLPQGFQWKMNSKDEIEGYIELCSKGVKVSPQAQVLFTPAQQGDPDVSISYKVKGRTLYLGSENPGGIVPPSLYKWNIGGKVLHRGYSTMYTFDKAGVYDITLQATGLNGKVVETTERIEVTGEVSNHNNIFDMESSELSFSNEKVSFQLDNKEDVLISIFSLRGQLIAQKNMGELAPGTHTIPIDANIAAGSYALSVNIGEKMLTKKFIRK